jgi:mannose-1-phosphate guanylyltransferase
VAWPARLIAERDPDGIMAVLAADHLIKPENSFRQAVSFAARLARDKSALVTFGIQPTRPDTGYGYIETSAPVAAQAKLAAFSARAFHEKPDRVRAKAFLAAGNFLWNSGIFVWSVKTILESFRQHLPALHRQLQDLGAASAGPRVKRFYSRVEKISIDYGVMEKAANIIVVKPDFSWDDVGAWPAIPRIFGRNPEGNYQDGAGIGFLTRNCTLINKSGRLVALCGLKDTTVVQTPEATLVIADDHLDQMKALLAEIRKHPLAKKVL